MLLTSIMLVGGKMNIKPLFDRVLIKVESTERKTNTGIVLPETSQERPQVGIVVAVGSGENLDGDKVGMKVCVGDKVVFNRYAGTELKLDQEKYLILRQIDIIGVYYD